MSKMFGIENKVAVITGASGALAGSIATSLAGSGATLALLTRKKSSVQSLLDEIKNVGGHAKAYEADILSEDSLNKVKNEILSDFGKIDILLNIAGGNLPGATVAPDQTIFDISVEDFKKVTELNLNGTLIPSLIFGKVMSEQKQGVIINYSSMAADRVITRVAGYSASKAAMENFTKWMAVEMATKFGNGLRVNAIAPGFFIGKQNKALLTNEDGSFTQRGKTIINNTPMGRFGEIDELNGAIHFLCSDAARFITGIVLPVDGGFSAFSGV
ncbi:SDR family oxidoreductase [Zobellia galactanivorans]|uniref:SDR family oxidoreductase n=1 Tax=Zobellia galactanivorans (strain DSM 12802 / CCUG 47099 / CIP 106680 / NCIMB 13871 / Dsij) TaxID=63186 RepID=UPI0026E37C1B|nr:SDR family oxidoreductase [Zobellia galactanivorans]MDO6808053.1 SDR family oxidoreductase [Zobellia galactanivorans]